MIGKHNVSDRGNATRSPLEPVPMIIYFTSMVVMFYGQNSLILEFRDLIREESPGQIACIEYNA